MKRAIFLGIFFLMLRLASATELTQWISSSTYQGCMYDDEDWHCKPTQLPNFIPLGFSDDGWLAYVTDRWGNVVQSECRYCPNPPCAGILLKNVFCDEPDCYSDSPTVEGDKCYCPFGTTVNELKTFHIKPRGELKSGCFPLKLEGDEYSVEFIYLKKLIYSEATVRGQKPKPELPGTQVFLVSKRMGRKLIYTINHGHGGFFPYSVQATGWLQTPFSKRIIVLIEGGDDINSDGYPTKVSNMVIPVDLSGGFR